MGCLHLCCLCNRSLKICMSLAWRTHSLYEWDYLRNTMTLATTPWDIRILHWRVLSHMLSITTINCLNAPCPTSILINWRTQLWTHLWHSLPHWLQYEKVFSWKSSFCKQIFPKMLCYDMGIHTIALLGNQFTWKKLNASINIKLSSKISILVNL